MKTLYIGVVGIETNCKQLLVDLLSAYHVNINLVLPVEQVTVARLNSSTLDGWLFFCDDDKVCDLLDELMDQLTLPTLFTEYPEDNDIQWGKRCNENLRQLLYKKYPELKAEEEQKIIRARLPAKIPVLQHMITNADEFKPVERDDFALWVLGASLGGPNALQAFLTHLPDDLPVSFILAQHIDNNFMDPLASSLQKYTGMRVSVLRHAHVLHRGEIVLVPADRRVEISRSRLLFVTVEDWLAPYAPNISQMISSVARLRQPCNGAIIFSGLCDDGVQGCQDLIQSGSLVWTQSTDSCINSSMPDAVATNSAVRFRGTPKALAKKLQHTLITEYQNDIQVIGE